MVTSHLLYRHEHGSIALGLGQLNMSTWTLETCDGHLFPFSDILWAKPLIKKISHRSIDN